MFVEVGLKNIIHLTEFEISFSLICICTKKQRNWVKISGTFDRTLTAILSRHGHFNIPTRVFVHCKLVELASPCEVALGSVGRWWRFHAAEPSGARRQLCNASSSGKWLIQHRVEADNCCTVLSLEEYTACEASRTLCFTWMMTERQVLVPACLACGFLEASWSVGAAQEGWVTWSDLVFARTTDQASSPFGTDSQRSRVFFNQDQLKAGNTSSISEFRYKFPILQKCQMRRRTCWYRVYLLKFPTETFFLEASFFDCQ